MSVSGRKGGKRGREREESDSKRAGISVYQSK